MLVKFPNGSAAYGLGYVPGEVADIAPNHVFKARVLTTLVDANGNPRGQDWREKDFSLQEFIQKGVVVQVSESEAKPKK